MGKGTTTLLNKLKVGIVGCSGTGSPTIEMLTRLGIGTIVLVDPDYVDPVNLNRIVGSTKEDAVHKKSKIEVLQNNIYKIDIGTRVVGFEKNVVDIDVIKELADFDILFGCVDSAGGRHVLNVISKYYLVPLFYFGVRLDADENRGIHSINGNGSVHFVQPYSFSLLSREVYTIERMKAESIKRTDRGEYERNVYLAKVGESSPAVISVNMLVASTGISDFLARINPYRNEPNSDCKTVRIGIFNGMSYIEEVSEPCSFFLNTLVNVILFFYWD
ncbi:ThiF family adenylyltransferase [Sphingobacterium faecium]|uniref:ThiF family adenylyltransferase n=1 Tax=Sphingobacterium faecium TaxID=34087 RepID=UPI003209A6FD